MITSKYMVSDIVADVMNRDYDGILITKQWNIDPEEVPAFAGYVIEVMLPEDHLSADIEHLQEVADHYDCKFTYEFPRGSDLSKIIERRKVIIQIR